MLSLLLAPLYGNNPGYGVRELIQNSVDAVEESLVIAGNDQGHQPFVRVELKLEGDDGRLTVFDNGIGMTLAVVKGYFFNAGASFRSAVSWKQEFVDASGKTKVIRNGRFGVGALAAFLIGSRIEVSTRHRTMTRGLYFSASLHDTQIEIREKNMDIGTLIEISVDRKSIAALKRIFAIAHQLFQFRSRVVVTYALIEEGERKEVSLNSHSKENYVVETANYRIGVSTQRLSTRSSEIHYVNGIAIASIADHMYTNGLIGKIRFLSPPMLFQNASEMFKLRRYSLSIIDRAGIAPVSLARNHFTQPDAEITEAVRLKAQHDIMSQLRSGPELSKKEINDTLGSLNQTGMLWYNGGICPIDVHVLRTTEICKVLNLPQNLFNLVGRINTKDIAVCFTGSVSGDLKTEFLDRMRSINLDAKHRDLGIVFVRTNFIHLLQLGNIPQWLTQKADDAEIFNVNGTDFSILSWGSAPRDTVAQLCNLANKHQLKYLEYFEYKEWSEQPRWAQFDNSQTEFSKLWIEEFKSTKSIFYRTNQR
ncbi:ATP-binding protein [Lichenibacterium dinghuense]|uniref:ATP-binding protein n=1 Tax=Lichenibacterium dinghuense TaxID=2895977 RepID=UPI001F27D46A|nr:ATP-binding protein [Lichenibacterium sp. 6Y81]